MGEPEKSARETTLEQALYLRHSVGGAVGEKTLWYHVLRADIIDELPVQAFDAFEKSLRYRIQLANTLNQFATATGKTLDAEAVKIALDTLLDTLGLREKSLEVDAASLQHMTEQIVDRLQQWKPDPRDPNGKARLLFLLSKPRLC